MLANSTEVYAYAERGELDLDDITRALHIGLYDSGASIEDRPDPVYEDLVGRIGQILAPRTIGGAVNPKDIAYLSGVFPGVSTVHPLGINIPGSSVYSYYQNPEFGMTEQAYLPQNEAPAHLLNTPNLSQENLIQALRRYDETGDPTFLSFVEIALALKRPATAIEDGKSLRMWINTVSNFGGTGDRFLDRLRSMAESFKRFKINATNDGPFFTFPPFALNDSLVYTGRTELKFSVVRHADPLIMSGEITPNYPTMALLVGIGPDIYPLDSGRVNPREADIDRILDLFTPKKIEDFMIFMRAIAMYSRSVADLMYSGRLKEPEEPIEKFLEYLAAGSDHKSKNTLINFLSAALRPFMYPGEFPQDPKEVFIQRSQVLSQYNDELMKEMKYRSDLRHRHHSVEAYALGSEIGHALEIARNSYENDVKFVFDFDPTWVASLTGVGFPDVVTQALDNIFFNAHRILTQTYDDKDKKQRIITVRIKPENDHLRLDVIDSGSGFPPDKIEQFSKGALINENVSQDDLIGVDGLIGGQGTGIFRTVLAYSGIPGSYEVGNQPEGGSRVTLRLRLIKSLSNKA